MRNRRYERAGQSDIPDWWMDLATERIKSANNADVAAAASSHAGRTSAWTGDAISKFFLYGTGRTRELTNGISHALGIPPPFFTARSAEEAEVFEKMQTAMAAASAMHEPAPAPTGIGASTEPKHLEQLVQIERRLRLTPRSSNAPNGDGVVTRRRRPKRSTRVR